MKERPILVTGGSGFLGGHLVSAFAEHYDTYYTYFSHPVQAFAEAKGFLADVADFQMLSELVETINPRLIFHTAAMSDFNQCASNPEKANKVNIQGTEHIAKNAKKVGARLINFSTDMVFDGTKSFYTENETPSPCCTYGKTKLVAEQACANILGNLLTIRLSLIYGISLNDSVCYSEVLAKKLLSGEKVSAFINEFRTPIFVEDVVAVLLELALRDDVRGVLHLAGPERLSRYELAIMIVKLLSLPEERLVPVTSDENSFFIEPRPKDCSLKSLRLSDWWCGRTTAPETGMASMIQKMQRINSHLQTEL